MYMYMHNYIISIASKKGRIAHSQYFNEGRMYTHVHVLQSLRMEVGHTRTHARTHTQNT